jgi:hypothetical protein
MLYDFISFVDYSSNFRNLIVFCLAPAPSVFSGTGALAIFLRKSYNLDITTSDYDDQEIMENIAHNCSANDLPVIPHIKREYSFERSSNLLFLKHADAICHLFYF